MRAVTLNYAEIMRLIKASFFVTTGFAALIVVGRMALAEHPQSWVMLAAQSVPMALLFTTLLFGLLANRPWTSRRLARWMGRPSIHGIWWGTLNTDWVDTTGRSLAPIPIIFVIRQSYLFVSIQSFTQSLAARSNFEFLGTDEKTTDMHLSYVYELRRPNEKKLTFGHGQLILQDEGKVLAGDYWTNSPTQGQLQLRFVTQACDGINSYESASRVIARVRDQDT